MSGSEQSGEKKRRRTRQRSLVCRDNASILGLEWARAETRAAKVSCRRRSVESQRRREELGHGSDVLDAETLLDKRDNHLELAAVAAVARVWDGDRLVVQRNGLVAASRGHGWPESTVSTSHMALVLLAFALVALALYILQNDPKLARLPSDAAKLAPHRVEPADVRADAARDVPSNINDQIPPRTGRRYIVVGGVSSAVMPLEYLMDMPVPGRLPRWMDRISTTRTRRGPHKDTHSRLIPFI